MILFELLTGEMPFRGEVRMLVVQILREEPPSPRKLNARVPRDLETITLKCMQKEPARRYQTARELAGDLQCGLEGRPILARPAGKLERGWRWCKRNPVVAGLAATVVLALASGTGISSYFAIRSSAFAVQANARAQEAVAERKRADTKADEAKANATRAADETQRAIVEAQKAQQVSLFLGNMFEESAPLDIFGLRILATEKGIASADLTAREILDRGAQRVSVELQEQPLVQAALLETIGNVYLGLGLFEKAETLLFEAFELRQKHLPREHLDVASSLHSIGTLRYEQSKRDESALALREAIAIRRKLLGEDHLLVDNSRLALSFLLATYYPGGSPEMVEAVKLARESLAWRRKHFGNTHRQTGFGMILLGATLLFNGENTEEGLKLMLEAKPILSSDPTTKPIGLLLTQFGQMMIFAQLGLHQAMADMSRKAMASAGDVFGEGHPLMGNFWIFVSKVYGSQIDDLAIFCRDWLERVKTRQVRQVQPLQMGYPFWSGCF